MTADHPFAPFIRILGKGPSLSRDLTEAEMADAAAMIMAGAVEPVQLGAFLCLLRIRSETPGEIAGFARAARATLHLPEDPPSVDLDWPCYAGKQRRLPWFVLSALLLAQSGVRVFLHGLDGHTPGRVWAPDALAALGIAPAGSLREAAAQLHSRNLAYLPLDHLCPRLRELMAFRSLLGLRSPVHTIVRHLNPFDAPCQIMGVAHPLYRGLHQGAARLLGLRQFAVFKGDGGEAERVPEKPCQVSGLAAGEPTEETWAPMLAEPRREADTALDVALLPRLWSGTLRDPVAEAAVVGTAAVALRAMGRADTQDDAEVQAMALWQDRWPLALAG
jgi:anthranilate phosphoribosyltransferase